MLKMNFEEIRIKVQRGDYEISVHAFERMRQRGISLADVENVINDRCTSALPDLRQQPG